MDTPVQRSLAEEALIAQRRQDTAFDCTAISTLGLLDSLAGRASSTVTIRRTTLQGDRAKR